MISENINNIKFKKDYLDIDRVVWGEKL